MHKNNFDFLRLVLASFVIITHTYTLTGRPEHDLLYHITNGQVVFSYIGITGFFTISGFLIFQSLNRSKTLVNYYWKRVLRLYPALIVVLIITVLLAPFVYQNNSIGFLHNKSVWTYIPLNLTLFKKQYAITGIFENNPYKGAINGSLWTLPYEFTMYLLLSALFYFRKRTFFMLSVVLTVYVIFLICNIFFMSELGIYSHLLRSENFLQLGLFFLGGSVLAAARFEEFKFINIALFSSLLLLVISVIFQFYSVASLVLLPLAIISFGLKSTPFINNISNKIGDLSYGVYIYAFPAEQALVHFFKFQSLELPMALTLFISVFFAYLSWHFVESKALKLKSIDPLAFLQRRRNPAKVNQAGH